jgi:UDP-2,3-diacylglucosamine pyrophosphatase LpxH
MRDVRCRTVWISDVHLGTRECAADALLAFLDRHQCDYLYLVGDIVYYLAGMWLEVPRGRYGARYASITFKIRSRAARLAEGSERSRPT